MASRLTYKKIRVRRSDTKALAPDVERAGALVSPRGWYSVIVALENMLYMLCDILNKNKVI